MARRSASGRSPNRGTNRRARAPVTRAACPNGKKLFGGGAFLNTGGGSLALHRSYPQNATTWIAKAYEIKAFDQNWQLSAYAICG